jgi:glycosyltransferase involved in cell wall biosynthesis
MEEPRLTIIELRRNYGQTAALQAGIDRAAGDIIVTLDADLQHFPEEIPSLIKGIEEGHDVVCGWRHQRQEGVMRRWPSRAANGLIRKASGLSIHDIGTTFRAYRREIISEMRLLGENHRFIPVFAKALGARIGEVPISNIERSVGKSNYGIGRTINVLIDVFFIYFFTHYLDRPMRIFGKFALLCGLAAGIIAAGLFWIWVTAGVAVVREHSGWFTLGFMLILAAVQFLLTGVIGEMLARLYFPSKERTTYQIRRVWDQESLHHAVLAKPH